MNLIEQDSSKQSEVSDYTSGFAHDMAVVCRLRKIRLRYSLFSPYFPSKIMATMFPKKILIDGYNVIKAPRVGFPGFSSLELQREHLIKVLKSHPQLRGSQTMVVFDSRENIPPSRTQKYGKLTIIFAPPDKSADEVIQHFVRRSSQPGDVLVVTSDRRIQFTAKDHGARAMESHVFWQKLQMRKKSRAVDSAEPKEGTTPLSDREVKEWLSLFRNRDGESNEK